MWSPRCTIFHPRITIKCTITVNLIKKKQKEQNENELVSSINNFPAPTDADEAIVWKKCLEQKPHNEKFGKKTMVLFKPYAKDHHYDYAIPTASDVHVDIEEFVRGK